MARHTPLARQWVLLRTLSARRYGVSVQEMARELAVNEKTIRRDLATFVEAGFPLEERVADHGRKLWQLRSAEGPSTLTFAFDEALALYLGRSFLEPLAGTQVWDAAQSAFRKVRAHLGAAALRYLDKMASGIHHTVFGAGDYSQKGAVLDCLLEAIADRRTTHLEYQSLRSTEAVTYEVCPYGVTYHRGSLYLVAWSREHEEIRHFKVNRIDRADPSLFPFHLPSSFSLQEHLSHSFGVFQGKGDLQIVVRFAAEVARYVEESRWHASQRLVRENDGSLRAEFRLSSVEEIKRWILSFGRHAQVLEPASLIDEIRAELAAAAQAYNRTASASNRRPRSAASNSLP